MAGCCSTCLSALLDQILLGLEELEGSLGWPMNNDLLFVLEEQPEEDGISDPFCDKQVSMIPSSSFGGHLSGRPVVGVQ